MKYLLNNINIKFMTQNTSYINKMIILIVFQIGLEINIINNRATFYVQYRSCFNLFLLKQNKLTNNHEMLKLYDKQKYRYVINSFQLITIILCVIRN